MWIMRSLFSRKFSTFYCPIFRVLNTDFKWKVNESTVRSDMQYHVNMKVFVGESLLMANCD